MAGKVLESLNLGAFLFAFLPGAGTWVHAASPCILLGHWRWVWEPSASACVMVPWQQTTADLMHSNINLVFLFPAGPLLLHA